MALPFYSWSLTAASNATADSTVNWAEGMAPSAVNDSARAMMASTAAYRDDIAGALTTGGTSTAYTITSNQVFDTLAHMDGAMIAFTPHATNGDTVTLNVDGLGAKPLRSAPSVEIPSNSLILGTPYVATYYNTAGEWILQGAAFSNPYGVPLAGGMDYWASTAPNSSFVFPYGQAISRTTYATLFAKIGGQYGVGDGSTTFNLPDKRGRLSAPLDNMGGTSASRLTPPASGGVSDSTVLGSVGGTHSHTLTSSQMPSHTHTGTTGAENTSLAHQHSYTATTSSTGAAQAGADRNTYSGVSALTTSNSPPAHTHNFTTNSTGSDAAHNNVQPTIMCNYILRVI